ISPTDAGNAYPSTTGDQRKGAPLPDGTEAKSWSAGMARSPASDGAPLAAAKRAPSASSSASGRPGPNVLSDEPLCAIARRKGPAASGDAVMLCTAAAPADWPAIVKIG